MFDELSEITVVGGELTVKDLKLETDWRAPVADITLTRDDERLFFKAAIDVQVDAQQATLDLNGQMTLASKAIALDAEFVNINPWSFSQISPKLKHLGIVNSPVSGLVAVTLSKDFDLQTLAFDLVAEAGRIYTPEPIETAISIRGAELKGTLDSRLKRLAISDLTVVFDERGLVKLPAPIDHDMLESEERENDPLQAVVVVRDSSKFFQGIFREELVTALGENKRYIFFTL